MGVHAFHIGPLCSSNFGRVSSAVFSLTSLRLHSLSTFSAQVVSLCWLPAPQPTFLLPTPGHTHPEHPVFPGRILPSAVCFLHTAMVHQSHSASACAHGAVTTYLQSAEHVLPAWVTQSMAKPIINVNTPSRTGIRINLTRHTCLLYLDGKHPIACQILSDPHLTPAPITAVEESGTDVNEARLHSQSVAGLGCGNQGLPPDLRFPGAHSMLSVFSTASLTTGFSRQGLLCCSP